MSRLADGELHATMTRFVIHLLLTEPGGLTEDSLRKTTRANQDTLDYVLDFGSAMGFIRPVLSPKIRRDLQRYVLVDRQATSIWLTGCSAPSVPKSWVEEPLPPPGPPPPPRFERKFPTSKLGTPVVRSQNEKPGIAPPSSITP